MWKVYKAFAFLFSGRKRTSKWSQSVRMWRVRTAWPSGRLGQVGARCGPATRTASPSRGWSANSFLSTNYSTRQVKLFPTVYCSFLIKRDVGQLPLVVITHCLFPVVTTIYTSSDQLKYPFWLVNCPQTKTICRREGEIPTMTCQPEEKRISIMETVCQPKTAMNCQCINE